MQEFFHLRISVGKIYFVMAKPIKIFRRRTESLNNQDYTDEFNATSAWRARPYMAYIIICVKGYGCMQWRIFFVNFCCILRNTYYSKQIRRIFQ